MKKKYFLLLLVSYTLTTFSQDYFPKNDGVVSKNTNFTAFTNAKIHISPSLVIEKGTLLMKDGKVISSGVSINIPKNTHVIDLLGKSIYPSFIDMYSDFGIEKPKRSLNRGQSFQYDASRTGYYWNDHVMPEQNGISVFKYDSKSSEELTKAGFGVVNTHVQDGIVRGTGVLIALNPEDGDDMRILDANSAQYLSFNKSLNSNQAYPSSLMGSMALLRQMYLDAEWYSKGASKTKDLSLEALIKNKNLVQIFEAGSRANVSRADKVGDENGIQYVILGGGDEYERINEIKILNAPLILPINFPDAYDVENNFLSESLSLSDMRSWNQQPSNPKILADNGITFALTTHNLKSPKEFKEKLMKAIKHGLSKEKALEALTTIPAKLLGKSNVIGTLNNGSYANLLISSGDIFEEKTIIFENWVQGKRHVLEDINLKDIRGNYEFKLAGDTYNMSLEGELNKLKSEITSNEKMLGSKASYHDDWLQITMTTKDSLNKEYIRMFVSPKTSNYLEGKATLTNGLVMPFSLSKIIKENDKSNSKDAKNDKKDSIDSMNPITYPNVAFGFSDLPKQETTIFKNATVWTNEAEGVLKNTDVLLKNGKISKIGKNLSETGAIVIYATGKHLTAGIIDEHSHIAAETVNESGHNSSAEVSIEDILDEKDINIYRNLSGGVTSIQVLHGSANPIGGRSAIIKLKWGESANNLVYKNSPKFIKFALGENVKQTRHQNGIRFPQSRMGVEQVFMDYFTRAKEYDALKKSGKPFRKDIEMDVLAEILNKERFISCHSYVQSEINMLIKVADKFNFNINTFTHILEGYKVATKMKKHGVGGSTFSDWWAYKFEVNDAIPYNAAIMHEAGVTVAINSDDAEMSRRLNQEAAKSIKYGDVSEEDALKFVTLNPAKLLHIDDRVGSIKVGKDADVVLWNDHPLSIYAKAEKTMIEGVTYFDITQDKIMQAEIQKEKSELMNLMLKEKNKGLKTQPIEKKEKELLHCDSIDTY